MEEEIINENDDVETRYLNYVTEVRADYESQEKFWKYLMNICFVSKVILLGSIPIASYCNQHMIVLLISGVIGILEFLPNYFKCELKLAALNESITKINYEYQMYFYDVEEDYAQGEKTDMLRLLVSNIERIKFETDLKVNNNYNTDAFKNIEPKTNIDNKAHK